MFKEGTKAKGDADLPGYTRIQIRVVRIHPRP